MDRLELLWFISPIVSFLGVYGIFIAARIPGTGWGVKGVLIVLSLVLPGLGWLIAVIVWIIRYRRLRKTDVKKEKASEFPSTSNLLHKRLFLVSKEVIIILVSFIIGELVGKFIVFATIAHLSNAIMDKRTAHLTDSSMRRGAKMRVYNDSIIRRRKDSVTHRILDSIIQSRIDSLKNLQSKNRAFKQ